jgi:hypothetical protein
MAPLTTRWLPSPIRCGIRGTNLRSLYLEGRRGYGGWAERLLQECENRQDLVSAERRQSGADMREARRTGVTETGCVHSVL